jgi:hypothetical protein
MIRVSDWQSPPALSSLIPHAPKQSGPRRSVWLLARVISLASMFSPLEWSSHGKLHINHWAVLVTQLSNADISVLSSATRQHWSQDEDPELGVLWELRRSSENISTLEITRPFRLSQVRKFWTLFSAMPLGVTSVCDDEIDHIGSSSAGLR